MTCAVYSSAKTDSNLGWGKRGIMRFPKLHLHASRASNGSEKALARQASNAEYGPSCTTHLGPMKDQNVGPAAITDRGSMDEQDAQQVACTSNPWLHVAVAYAYLA